MALRTFFALYWIFAIIGFVVGNEKYEIDPDCEYILEQLSRFPPSNAIVTRDGFGVRYECINGNRMVSGDKERICDHSQLIGKEPECALPKVDSCGNPGPIEYGYFIGSDFNVSSHIKYTCYKGFKMHGNLHRKCMDNGLWSEPPKCIFDDELELDLTKATDVISTSLLHNLHVPQCADSESNCQSASTSRRRRAINVEHGGGLDLVFMFDGSSSIKKDDFRMGLRFAQELIRILDATVRRGGIKAAALTFANNMRINFEFLSSSARTLKKIWSIRKPGGCGSNLGRAMFLLRKRIAPKVRRESRRSLFVITNGRLILGTSHKRAARLLKVENRFEVFVIGIGKNPDKEVLSTLVSDPVKEHFIGLKVYSDVFSSVRKAVTSRTDNVKCGISGTKPKSRSIRGNKAASGVWPWQVGIYWDRGRFPICGGALIGEQWVLTAAQCFHSNGRKAIIWPPWRYTVTVGDHDTRKETGSKQMAPVDKIYLHRDYRYKTNENDIALIKLQYKFKLGKYVRPVCLPHVGAKRRKSAESGKHGFVAEWDRPADDGSRSIRRKSRSRILVHTALAISPSQQCANMTSKPFNSSFMFCAMDKKAYKRDCRGDGGSPFVSESYEQSSRDYRWSLDGLVSWDEKCGSRDHHRFFTRVLPFLNWIEKITKEHRKH